MLRTMSLSQGHNRKLCQIFTGVIQGTRDLGAAIDVPNKQLKWLTQPAGNTLGTVWEAPIVYLA